MPEVTKVITLLVLFQLGGVIGISLFVRTLVRKFKGSLSWWNTEPIPGLIVFVADYGLWFMAVPVICALAFVWRPRHEGGEPSSGPVPEVTSLVLTCLLSAIFLPAAIQAMQYFFGP